MSDKIKYFLEESKMPKTWYNIAADLPKPLSPVLHPGTLKPIGPDDLAPLFPMALIGQKFHRIEKLKFQNQLEKFINNGDLHHCIEQEN